MAKNKKVTIEDLAGMVKKGFDGVDSRFDKVEKRLDVIENKLTGIVYRNEFDKLQGRVETLENLLAVTKKQ